MFFDVNPKQGIFRDSENTSNYYVMGQESWDRYCQLSREFNGRYSVPDEYLVKINPVKYSGPKNELVDVYKPSVDEVIDFQVKRVEFVPIRHV